MKKFLSILMIVFVFVLSSCNEVSISTGINPGIDTVEINTDWTDTGAYLSTSGVYLVVYSEDEVDITTLGTYEMTYSITYQEEVYTITRMVKVVDYTPPVLSILPGLDTVKQGSTWVDGGCEVTDNSNETVTCATTVTIDTSIIGEYEVVYTATDSSGNEGTITRVVNVVE